MAIMCFIFLTAFTTTPVTIGLQQLQYSNQDTADYQFVCAEVMSGSIAGRDITLHYVVSDAGMLKTYT